MLNTGFALGAFRLSLGQIVGFILAVWASFLVSKFLRFLLEVSAVTQNQPLKVEIKDFKTSHFLEKKTAPGKSPDAGPMEHVELPKVSLQTTIYSLDDRGWSRRRIARELGIDRETVGRYLRLAKPAISTAGLEEAGKAKPAISIAGLEEAGEAKPAISIAGL